MKVLFIGNSYTECNDLPGMVCQLVTNSGKNIETSRVTVGGQTLEGHWYSPETLDAISGDAWDIVVMQEQSTRPVEDSDKFLSAAMRFERRIRSIGATPILYLTWGRKHIPEMWEPLIQSYRRVSREIKTQIVPVGPAWQKAIIADSGLQLYEDDRSHPTVLGTYLAACVFFASFTGESPVGSVNEIAGAADVATVVRRETALLLQKSAWDAYTEETTHNADLEDV